MVGWRHRLNGNEFEQVLGDSERQESLVCCSLWGRKESELTEPLNTRKNQSFVISLRENNLIKNIYVYIHRYI